MGLPQASAVDVQAVLDALLRRPAMPTPPVRQDIRGCARPGARCWTACRARCMCTHPLTGRTRDAAPDPRHAARHAARAAVCAGVGVGAAGGHRRSGRAGASTRWSGWPPRSAPARLAEGMHFSVVCSEDAPRCRGDRARRGLRRPGSRRCTVRSVRTGRAARVDDAFYTLAPAPPAGAAAVRRGRSGDAAASRPTRGRRARCRGAPCGRFRTPAMA